MAVAELLGVVDERTYINPSETAVAELIFCRELIFSGELILYEELITGGGWAILISPITLLLCTSSDHF